MIEVPGGGSPMGYLARRYGVEEEDLDGWTVAVNLTRNNCRIVDPGLRFYAEKLAASAVLARAARLVGPLRGTTQVVREILREPFAGELDVEATLENVLGKAFPEPGDWVDPAPRGAPPPGRDDDRHLTLDVGREHGRRRRGRGRAGAQAQAGGPGRGGVRGQGAGRDASRVGGPAGRGGRAACSTSRCAATPTSRPRWSSAPPSCERGRNPRRSGLLITDGVVTAGGDPVPLAHRFPRLFVLLTEDYKMNPELLSAARRRRARRRFPSAHLPRSAGAPARCRQPRAAIDCAAGAAGAPLTCEETPVGVFGPPNVAKLEAAGKIDGLVRAARYKKDPAVAADARRALTDYLDKIIQRLQTKNIVQLNTARDALVIIGEPARDRLIFILQQGHLHRRQDAAYVLGMMGDPVAVKPLCVACTTPTRCCA